MENFLKKLLEMTKLILALIGWISLFLFLGFWAMVFLIWFICFYGLLDTLIMILICIGIACVFKQVLF